jgi:hypothetical protein
MRRVKRLKPIPGINFEFWGEIEQRAYGSVRIFLQTLSDEPQNKARLNRLAKEAHKALYMVERTHRLAEMEPNSMDHP